MFRILKYLIAILAFIFLQTLMYFLIIDPIQVVDIIDEIQYHLSNRTVQIIIVAVIIIYDLIVVVSYLEYIIKRNKTIKVNSKNGKVEVALVTLEDISKSFVEKSPVVKSAKVRANATYFGPIININIENYRAEKLNEKLNNIKEELEKHIEEMLGFKPRKINISINKINNETVIEEIKEIEEEKIIEEVVE